MPVAVRVAAGAAVFEGDAVFAAPAPGGHGDSSLWWGQTVVTTASHTQPLADPSGHELAAEGLLPFQLLLVSG